MASTAKKRPGPKSLFAGKVRAPVSLTLTPDHHRKLEGNMRRLDLTRADFIGLLIERYADVVVLPEKKQRYERLRDALGVLGGRLERRGFGGPKGETWTVELGGRCLPIESDGKGFPLLDRCYATEPGTAGGEHDEINPAGVADLLSRVAAS